ncbi:MAG: ABC transporter ATP-binding protein [Deltaproteobacteria bacterium]|nr:ABC transporter ATP-binding protein [Deltaproteobacteria bacterium]
MKDKSLLKMIGITKRFQKVLANDNVDFDLCAGEIHSLLGENGAGKSTLMNILSGMYQPDAGSIIVRGQKVKIDSPQDSLKLGIGMVYQHFALIPNLTVIENLMLGFEGGIFLKLKKAERKLQHISKAYGLSIDPYKMIQDLSVSERQRTEILKILFHDSDIFVLDEPTSVLAPAETDNLFHTLKLLRKAGKTVVLITHNISEALAISNRITIMKAGRKTAELSGDSLAVIDPKTVSDKILSLMFGAIPRAETGGLAEVFDDDPVLELKKVGVLDNRGQIGLKHISFGISKGEIVGITGVAGEGRRLLAEALGGQRRVAAGKLFYLGRDITQTGVTQRFELGISNITDDRLNKGCVPDMKLSENSILQSYYQHPYSRFGILNRRGIRSSTGDLISRFGIRATGPEALVSTLSGGNIQKFILARSLRGKPALIICSSPTYGLDAQTVRFIRELLKEESRRGTAILLLTSDMDELFSCSTRIGVIFNREIVGFMDRCDATTERVAKLMIGIY